MKLTKEQEKGQELLQTLVKKAWESASFKEQLVNNPELAIQQVADEKVNLTHGMKISVEDQTDSNIIYLNIPAKVKIENIELTEEQLNKVSGGRTPFYDLGVYLYVHYSNMYETVF